ncbi:MAG: hypothetical protein ACRD11_13850 [Terriglobia bacterium]
MKQPGGELGREWCGRSYLVRGLPFPARKSPVVSSVPLTALGGITSGFGKTLLLLPAPSMF